MDFLAKSLKSQMRTANKLLVPYVLILGPEELKEEKITVKNMENGVQEEISLDDILPYLQKHISGNS